ncbi:hypothetical protein D3C77_445590 [compost metagenome]
MLTPEIEQADTLGSAQAAGGQRRLAPASLNQKPGCQQSAIVQLHLVPVDAATQISYACFDHLNTRVTQIFAQRLIEATAIKQAFLIEPLALAIPLHPAL